MSHCAVISTPVRSSVIHTVTHCNQAPGKIRAVRLCRHVRYLIRTFRRTFLQCTHRLTGCPPSLTAVTLKAGRPVNLPQALTLTHMTRCAAGDWESSQYAFRSFDPGEVLESVSNSRQVLGVHVLLRCPKLPATANLPDAADDPSPASCACWCNGSSHDRGQHLACASRPCRRCWRVASEPPASCALH